MGKFALSIIIGWFAFVAPALADKSSAPKPKSGEPVEMVVLPIHCEGEIRKDLAPLCLQQRSIEDARLGRRVSENSFRISAISALVSAISALVAVTGALIALGNLRSNRAWLLCKSPFVVPEYPGDPDFTGTARVIIRQDWINAGRSPALEVHRNFIIQSVPAGSQVPVFDATIISGGRNIFAPNEPIMGASERIIGPEAQAVIEGLRDLYIFSFAEYRDIYSAKIRKTQICTRIHIRRDAAYVGGYNNQAEPFGSQNRAT